MLQLDARGIATGAAEVTTEMTTPLVDGTTVVTAPVTVSRERTSAGRAGSPVAAGR